jgi:hypothetical protein
LAINPDYVEAHYNLAMVFKVKLSNSEINKLKQLLKRKDLPEDDENLLLFATPPRNTSANIAIH